MLFWFGALAGIAATLLVEVLVMAAIVAVAEWERKREEKRRILEERRKAVEEVERCVRQRR